MHIAATPDPGTGVDVLRGAACAYVTEKIGICGDAMFIHGDEQPMSNTLPTGAPGGSLPAVDSSATSIYGGVLVGFAIN